MNKVSKGRPTRRRLLMDCKIRVIRLSLYHRLIY